MVGHRSASDSVKFTLRGGGLLYCGTRKMGFLRDMQNAL